MGLGKLRSEAGQGGLVHVWPDPSWPMEQMWGSRQHKGQGQRLSLQGGGGPGSGRKKKSRAEAHTGQRKRTAQGGVTWHGPPGAPQGSHGQWAPHGGLPSLGGAGQARHPTLGL